MTPIASPQTRIKAFWEKHGAGSLFFSSTDLCNYKVIYKELKQYQPDCIVHLGEMPSAPFSMIDAKHACLTHTNNLSGTLNILHAMREVCPEAHLLKLGTMGEYGTPSLIIPEGFFTIKYRGRKDTLPFPRQAGSWYHQTKVHDSNNIMLACKIWGLRSTDIMQGVVYGTRIPEMGNDERLLTRFDVDQCFGTFINRACACAVIGHPITLFGAGHQKRGFLPLRDSMQCLTLAIENPPKAGEYRVFNQFEEVYGLTELAEKVKKVGDEIGLDVRVANYENPRKEAEEHYYNPDHQHLLDLGYRPTHDMESELKAMLTNLVKYKSRIEQVRSALIPDIRWDGTRRRSDRL